MNISHFEEIAKTAQWLEKVARANIFFQPSFERFCTRDGGKIVYVYSRSYIMPIVISKKLIFRYASLPTEPFKYCDVNESLADFLTEACEYAKRTFKLHWINEPSTSALFMDYPDKSKHIPFGSHVIDLSMTEDEMWKKMHSKHRNVIKKSENDGVVIMRGRSEELIRDYHTIDIDTWKRSNKTDAGLKAIKDQIDFLGENAIIYMAYYEGKPQSGALFYYNEAMCYYMYGANCNKPHTGAGNLLQWCAMLEMKTLGVKKYSFVGCRINEAENSKFHGIQRFKERFGGELVKGYLFKVIFNKPLYLLFKFLVCVKLSIETKKITVYKDVIDQEIKKWE